MRKPVLILIIATLAIGVLASFVRGSVTNAQRAEIQRQCEMDPSCDFYLVQK